MKPIRTIIARRRPLPAADPGAGALPARDAIPADRPTRRVTSDDFDRDLEAARAARDAVPRYSDKPQTDFGDGRPTEVMQSQPQPQPQPVTELPRRKIWDIDPPAREVPRAPSPRPAEPVTLPLAEAAPTPTPTPAPVPPGRPRAPEAGGRVKTRLLGFHAEDLAQDIFDAPATPAATPAARFPIGWVVVVEGPGRGACFTLTAGLSTIGRGADQTIALGFGDSSISRNNHAAIAYDDDENRVFIGHGGKSNVVRLNGKPLLTTEELHHGDMIRIGKTTLRFVGFCGPDFRWSDDQGDTDAHDDAAD